MGTHVLLGIIAFCALSALILVTVQLQRQARMNRRLTHVENELGITDDERAQVEENGAVAVEGGKNVRAKLFAVERKTDAVHRRVHRRA